MNVKESSTTPARSPSSASANTPDEARDDGQVRGQYPAHGRLERGEDRRDRREADDHARLLRGVGQPVGRGDVLAPRRDTG